MSVVLPDDLTTKVAAVNVLLQTISQSPVASLDTTLSVDVASAIQAIDEVDRAFQAKGWHWNREEAWELEIDDTGQIALPANYLWVGRAYWTNSGTVCRVSERARQLYNRDAHSFVFPDPVTVDIVLKLEWEEMPEYARQYITIAAANLFQARLQGTPIIQRVTDLEVQGAMSLVEQREDEAEPQNIISGNRGVSNIFNRTPLRRS